MSEKKSPLQNLISSALQTNRPAQPEPKPEGQGTTENIEPTEDHDDPQELRAQAFDTLVQLFLGSENEAERLEILESLISSDVALLSDFLDSVSHEDPNPYFRARALAMLAEHGDHQAQERLEAEFETPETIEPFVESLEYLTKVHGMDFFPKLEGVFRNSNRSLEERLQSMLQMENLEPNKTQDSFLEALFSEPPVEVVDIEIFERALETLARNGYMKAMVVLNTFLTKSPTNDHARELIIEIHALIRETLPHLT